MARNSSLSTNGEGPLRFVTEENIDALKVSIGPLRDISDYVDHTGTKKTLVTDLFFQLGDHAKRRHVKVSDCILLYRDSPSNGVDQVILGLPLYFYDKIVDVGKENSLDVDLGGITSVIRNYVYTPVSIKGVDTSKLAFVIVESVNKEGKAIYRERQAPSIAESFNILEKSISCSVYCTMRLKKEAPTQNIDTAKCTLGVTFISIFYISDIEVEDDPDREIHVGDLPKMVSSVNLGRKALNGLSVSGNDKVEVSGWKGSKKWQLT